MQYISIYICYLQATLTCASVKRSAPAGTISVQGISSDLGQGYLSSQQVSNKSSSTRCWPSPKYLGHWAALTCSPRLESIHHLCIAAAALLSGTAVSWSLLGGITNSVAQTVITSCKRLQITALVHRCSMHCKLSPTSALCKHLLRAKLAEIAAVSIVNNCLPHMHMSHAHPCSHLLCWCTHLHTATKGDYHIRACQVTDAFQAAKDLGLTVMRTWAFNDGPNSSFALQPQPGQLDAFVFR